MGEAKFSLCTLRDKGLYCPAGDFYIDPTRGVNRAVVTHAHADHARYGSKHYFSTKDSESVLRLRLGEKISLKTVPYFEPFTIGKVEVTFIPSGHTIGSAQVKITDGSETWIIAGDYKLEDDGVSKAFEHETCDVFVTEATFALPIYNWRPQEEILNEIQTWWRENANEGKVSILTCYSFGKAQRLTKLLKPENEGIFLHGAIWKTNEALRNAGFQLPLYSKPLLKYKDDFPGSLVLCPDSALNHPWIKRFGNASTAKASGWMQIRGIRRRANLDRGFVLSDHADWNGLLTAIKRSKAKRVYVTHGYNRQLSRWLREEEGVEAFPLEKRYF